MSIALQPLVPWDDVSKSFVWRGLSTGIYRRIPGSLCFDVDFKPVPATLVDWGVRMEVPRMTIVASRA